MALTVHDWEKGLSRQITGPEDRPQVEALSSDHVAFSAIDDDGIVELRVAPAYAD